MKGRSAGDLAAPGYVELARPHDAMRPCRSLTAGCGRRDGPATMWMRMQIQMWSTSRALTTPPPWLVPVQTSSTSIVLCWPWTLPLRSDDRLSCTLTLTPTRPPWRRRTTASSHTLRCACLSLQTAILSQHEDDESASRATALNAVNLTSPYALDPPPGLGRRRLRLGQFAGDAATTPLPIAHLGPVALSTLAALS